MAIGFNTAVFRKQINPQLNRFAYPTIQKRMTTYVEKVKEEAIQEFESHGVTQELEEGAGATNSKYLPQGNLTALFGYESSEIPPTEIVRDMLENDIEITNFRKTRPNNGVYRVEARVRIPTIKSINENTPLPWFSGRGLVDAVERGVSGFMRTIFGDFGANEASRSGGGLQVKNKVRDESFKGIGRGNYISGILTRLARKIRNK